MSRLLYILTSTNNENSSEAGTTEKLTNALKELIKSPVFYIVIGALILLIIAIYLFRRIVKPNNNTVSVIVRKNKIHKLVDAGSSTYFMVPFVDKLGAVISLNEKELLSDKLFINNGPDALYQINYTLKYRVVNPEQFYLVRENISNLIIERINDDLRKYADMGNAPIIVQHYRENSLTILELINKAIEEYGVEGISLKINLIQPLGK